MGISGISIKSVDVRQKQDRLSALNKYNKVPPLAGGEIFARVQATLSLNSDAVTATTLHTCSRWFIHHQGRMLVQTYLSHVRNLDVVISLPFRLDSLCSKGWQSLATVLTALKH